VVLRVRDRRLDCLLWQRAKAPFDGQWSLPRGPLGATERLGTSASRHLAAKVDITSIAHMEQLETRSDPDRDPRQRVLATAYLALVATTLPGDSPDDAKARESAREIVLASAQSAWDNRQSVQGLPLFGPFWDRPADLPATGGLQAEFVAGAVTESEIPERDLSVQLSGWMLMEAAHAVTNNERTTDE